MAAALVAAMVAAMVAAAAIIAVAAPDAMNMGKTAEVVAIASVLPALAPTVA